MIVMSLSLTLMVTLDLSLLISWMQHVKILHYLIYRCIWFLLLTMSRWLDRFSHWIHWRAGTRGYNGKNICPHNSCLKARHHGHVVDYDQGRGDVNTWPLKKKKWLWKSNLVSFWLDIWGIRSIRHPNKLANIKLASTRSQIAIHFHFLTFLWYEFHTISFISAEIT